ncbi:MAG TPA: hypothetical protein VFO76_05040 [Candidatus Kapabacteria bacterium]|nr:hypothetical protein [Candidatus Kapabacteria bacterium]
MAQTMTTDSRSMELADIGADTMEAEFALEHTIAYRDITVLCGENLRENTISAFHKAMDLRGVFERALVINTSLRQHWALQEGRKVDKSAIGDDFNHSTITVVGMPLGDLCYRFAEIMDKIERYDIKLLIINSWEFAASDARYREKLIFQLRRLLSEREITVLVYAQNKASCEDVGINTRGKLGKLSAIAGMIVLAENSKQREERLQAEKIMQEREAAEELKRPQNPLLQKVEEILEERKPVVRAEAIIRPKVRAREELMVV